ncbi:MAG: hypothetical protein QM758_11320 [Armatimonas sp.]
MPSGFQRPQPVVVTGEGVSTEQAGAPCYELAAQAAIQPAPGATVKYDAVEQAPMPQPGQTAQVVVPITATGPDLLPVKHKVSVPLQRRVLPRPEADTLLFSNNPERIEKFQTLYVGHLERPRSLALPSPECHGYGYLVHCRANQRWRRTLRGPGGRGRCRTC